MTHFRSPRRYPQRYGFRGIRGGPMYYQDDRWRNGGWRGRGGSGFYGPPRGFYGGPGPRYGNHRGRGGPYHQWSPDRRRRSSSYHRFVIFIITFHVTSTA